MEAATIRVHPASAESSVLLRRLTLRVRSGRMHPPEGIGFNAMLRAGQLLRSSAILQALSKVSENWAQMDLRAITRFYGMMPELIWKIPWLTHLFQASSHKQENEDLD